MKFGTLAVKLLIKEKVICKWKHECTNSIKCEPERDHALRSVDSYPNPCQLSIAWALGFLCSYFSLFQDIEHFQKTAAGNAKK